MRSLGRQTPRAVGSACSGGDMKAEVLTVFCSVKPNTGSEGCDRTLIRRSGRSDTGKAESGTDRQSQSYKRRGKNGPAAFFHWLTITCRTAIPSIWSSSRYVVCCFVFFHFLLSPKHCLTEFEFLSTAVHFGKAAEVWSFPVVSLIFNRQQSPTSLVFADMTVGRLLLLCVALSYPLFYTTR